MPGNQTPLGLPGRIERGRAEAGASTESKDTKDNTVVDVAADQPSQLDRDLARLGVRQYLDAQRQLREGN